MSQLHKIDRPEESKKYTKRELDEFMVFCILDTAVPYEMVCKTFDALKKSKMITREGILKWREDMIAITLKSSGYRFPNQQAKRIKDFGYSMIDLKTATREELVQNIKGVGMKLASMFLRNTRGHKYAVLDVHTTRWLQGNYHFTDKQMKQMSYEQKEQYFLLASEFLGKSPMELDLEIWEANRVGNR